MRKKCLSQLLATMMVAMLSLSMYSCGEDDDESIVGSWVKWDFDDNIAQGYIFKEKTTWEFYDNGLGQYTIEETQTIKSGDYTENLHGKNGFSYEATGGKSGSVKITILSKEEIYGTFPEGKTFEWDYSINGNTLTLNKEQFLTASAAQEPVPGTHIVTLPEVSILAATATSIEFNVSIKVESEEYPDYCTLYYATSYYSSSEPSKSSFKTVKCRMDKNMSSSTEKYIYYYSASKAGFAGAEAGSRIYFFVETKNRAGTAQTPVQYVSIRGGMSY